MFRGITESDAVSLIIRGFIDVTMQGLRPNLSKPVDMAVDTFMRDVASNTLRKI